MKLRRTLAGLALAFTLFTWTAMSVQSQEQSAPSYVPLTKFGNGDDLKQRLLARFGVADLKRENTDLLRKLLEAAKKNRTKEDWQKFLKNDKTFSDPAMLERLKQFAEGQAKTTDGGGTPEVSFDKLQDLAKRIQNKDPSVTPVTDVNIPPDGNPPETPPDGTPPATTPDRELSNDQRTQQLTQWMEKNFGPLSQNPAIKELLLDLTNADAEQYGTQFNEMFGDLSQYKGEFSGLGNWAENQFGAPSSWKLPDFNFKGPDLSFGSGSGNLPSLGSGPSVGGGSFTPTVEGTWLPVALFGLIVGGALFYWWYRGLEWQKLEAAEPSIEERLGPWPIDPRKIRTAAEFILAFEYLALTQFGMETRTWNHRDVAEALFVERPQFTAGIDQMTDVYEIARYAPNTVPLNPEAIDLARKALCQFIGVPTV